MSKERLEEMKEASCFACHVEILWKDPMCIHNNKSYCRNCYLQVLRKQNQRYKQALEYTQSELEYAHVTGNMNLRNDLIKKSLKAIDKSLAGDIHENERKS